MLTSSWVKPVSLPSYCVTLEMVWIIICFDVRVNSGRSATVAVGGEKTKRA